MQLQQSVFSLHNAMVRKPPVFVCIGMLTVMLVILLFQTVHYASQPEQFQFSECFFEYYQMTRPQQNKSDKNQSKQNNNQNNSTKQLKQNNIQQNDIRLTPQYYKLFNQTTIAKIYLSDDVKYIGNSAKSCRILLKNTQTLDKNVNDSINNNNEIKKTDQKNSDAIYFDDKNHPTMHLAKNQHLISLDFNDKKFKQKHEIIQHVIILPKNPYQNQQAFPIFFGISSKYWRFHTKEQLTQNQKFINSIGKSLKKLEQKVQLQYQNYIKKKLSQQSQENKNSTENKNKNKIEQKQAENKSIVLMVQNDKNNNVMKADPQKSKTNLKQNNETVSLEKLISGISIQFPELTEISVVSQLILYYHVAGLTYQEHVSTIIHSLQSMTIFVKIFMLVIIIAPILVLSVIIGLLVRYLFISLLTAYLFLGGCWINQQWGWVYQYFNIIRRRVQEDRNASLLSSLKMSFHLTIAMIGTYIIMTLGVKHIIDTIWIHSLVFSDMYYSQMFIKNMFFVELFYFFSCRSRTSIRFYPLFSILTTIFIVYSNAKCYFCQTTWLINLHMWIHLVLFFVFAIIQNLVGNYQADQQYRPSLQKPRALYYAGYDISWQNSLPPIWTYFTRWFDLSHFGKSQKSFINKDYRLLYGRMLGMNQQQQLPQQAQFQLQEQVHKLNQNLNDSNESGLLG